MDLHGYFAGALEGLAFRLNKRLGKGQLKLKFFTEVPSAVRIIGKTVGALGNTGGRAGRVR